MKYFFYKKCFLGFLFAISAFAISSCKHYESELQPDVIPLDVSVITTENYIHIYPNQTNKSTKYNIGVLFYPGGAVAPEAYNQMLAGLAQKGYPVCTIKMPLDLAVLDAKKGLKYLDKFQGVSRWIIVGHSLGGAMAADVIATDSDKFKALVFLAAYPNKTLKDVTMPTVSIYGSNDKVADQTKIKDETKQPTGTRFVEIKGGNHAQFGSYGTQKGDGDATISEHEQHLQTQTAILNLLATL
jgi:dienelactone hydrolase